MVFGTKKLQNDVFCLTEERDFFQGKFLEQVSEITALKEDLRLARKEITKLRQQLMDTSMGDNIILNSPQSSSPKSYNSNQSNKIKEADNTDLEADDCHEDDDDDASTRTPQEGGETSDDDDDDEDGDSINDDDDEDREAQDIRQSAEKLLQWATYRHSVVSNTPTSRTVATDHSSVSSSLSHNQDESSFDVPRTIKSESLLDDINGDNNNNDDSSVEALR